MLSSVKMTVLMCLVFVLVSSTIQAATPVTYTVPPPEISDGACEGNETECVGGCCPHPNGVCCPETRTCCPEGGVCLGSIPHCLTLMQADDSSSAPYSLHSEMSTALRETGCPSGTTECTGGCCPLPNAVCCQDGLTCCPDGTTCGPPGSGLCYRGPDLVSRFLNAVLARSGDRYYAVNHVLPERRPSAPTAATCPSGWTECSGGCCPLSNAVCCEGGLSCCPHGTTCGAPGSGLCYRDGNAALARSVDLYHTALPKRRLAAPTAGTCPSGTTECTGGCCPLPNAVCCQDGLTCCPHDTTCGAPGSGLCYRGPNLVSRFLNAVLARSRDQYQTVNDVLPERRSFAPTAGYDCCYAWFGFICCQDPSVCTAAGCL